MAKSGRKRKTEPPKFAYPTSPYVSGLNWIEMPVADPQAAADRYVSIGFTDRGEMEGVIRIGIGGVLVHLVPGGKGKPRSRTSRPSIRFDVAVDQIEMKHKQLEMLELKPGPMSVIENGSRAFEWQDEDGYQFRFVGPARRADDPITL